MIWLGVIAFLGLLWLGSKVEKLEKKVKNLEERLDEYAPPELDLDSE